MYYAPLYWYSPAIPVRYFLPPYSPSTASSSRSFSPYNQSQTSPPWSRSAPSPRDPPQAPMMRTIPLPDLGRERPSKTHAPSYNTPTVNLLIASPQHPMSKPSFSWNVLFDPRDILFERALSRGDLERWAVRSSWRDGRKPLQSLVLVFPFLSMQIKITPTFSSHGFVTIRDVLKGIYDALREPIGDKELLRLYASEHATLLRAAERRRRYIPEDKSSRDGLRKIDFLSHRNIFHGIRPALPYEVPAGRKLGEVFVVEVERG